MEVLASQIALKVNISIFLHNNAAHAIQAALLASESVSQIVFLAQVSCCFRNLLDHV